jgi:hypothetical protein
VGNRTSCKEPVKVTTTVKDEEVWIKDENEKTTDMTLELIQPYDLLQYLFDVHGLEIPDEHVINYWEKIREHQIPWSTGHPATDSHVPVGIFYDKCAFMNISMVETEKVFGIFINLPLWRPRSARNSRWLIFSLRDELILPNEKTTLYPILEVIVASLNKAFMEKVTKCGKSFFVSEFRGDWEGHKSVWGLQCGWKSVQVCHSCGACQFGRSPSILCNGCKDGKDEKPPWVKTEYTLVEFLARCIDPEQPCKTSIVWHYFAQCW